jgi:hypothetical protein
LPTLPLDPVARERVLAVVLLAKDQAARRLLALVGSGDLRSLAAKRTTYACLELFSF